MRLLLLWPLLLTLGAGCSEQPSAVSTPGGKSPRESVVVSADWPRLYGPNGTCESPENGLSFDWHRQPPTQLWSADIGTGYSAPVVVGHRVVVQYRIEDQEIAECLDRETGQSLWKQAESTDFECDYPTYSSGPYSTPSIHHGRVYLLGSSGILRVLNLEDGSSDWSRNLSHDYQVPQFGYSVGHSVLCDGQQVFVNVGGTLPQSTVVALDAATGETLWTAGVPDAKNRCGSHSTPVLATIHGKRLLFVLSSEHLLCLQPEDGNLLWSFAFGTDTKDTPNSTTPVIDNDLVLLSMFRAGTICLKIGSDSQYQEIWENRRSIESCFNPLTCIDGFVYGWHSFDRTLRCADIHTGTVQWKHKTQLARGSHIAVGGHLIVLGEQGHLGCVRISPEQVQPIWMSESAVLAGPCFSMPALAAGRLLIRNEKQLKCYRLPVSHTR